MYKESGLTLVELLVTITVSVILASITIPSMMTWYNKDRFIQQSQDIVDALYGARSASLADKKCSNNSASSFWVFKINTSGFALECIGGGGSQAEKDAPFNNQITLASVRQETSSGSSSGPLPDNNYVYIKFVSGSGQAKIYLEDENFSLKKVGFTFEFAGDASLKRTICFDRIAGFPTISLTDACDE